ncbi:MAG: SAM-dependent methyltransferase [Chitinophagaceae bacterium]|nr:SAM-dependent methyltransferase [Chitinophagaceae bacterium]
MERASELVVTEFVDLLKESISKSEFVKLTLSKASRSLGTDEALTNVYIRSVLIKEVLHLSFTYRYKTNDQVKNVTVTEGILLLKAMIGDSFLTASLFTTTADFTLFLSKKGKATLTKLKPTFAEPASEEHDRTKKKRVLDNDAYLHLLGITDEAGIVIPRMSDKYRQINKYLEIIESLIKEAELPKVVNIADMGSGKGYLTFALYDYLHNKLGLDVKVVGIELRQELVASCNSIAKRCGFGGLTFESKRIEEFANERIDVLIALHACDTATDDAIQKGLSASAALIICAPCCHKQIRQQLKGKEQHSPLLKYGIFKERQFEMVTDTIRALIMEQHQYSTKIFEFISNEHTRKNVMLIGVKNSKAIHSPSIQGQIESLKKEFGIEYHYLEKIVS